MSEKNWVNRFVKSTNYELTSSFLSEFDISYKQTDNLTAYKKYFQLIWSLIDSDAYVNIAQLRKKMTVYTILPENIYNMNEKEFFIDILQKIYWMYKLSELQKSELRDVSQDDNRSWIILLTSCCINRTSLLLTIIYQAVSDNIQDTWLDSFDSKEHCCFFASSNMN